MSSSTIYSDHISFRLPRNNYHYINNEFINFSSEYDNISVINPTTEQILLQIPEANENIVNMAVNAAKNAFNNGWGTSLGIERSNYLLDIANIIRENKDYLSYLECIDNGKPIGEAEWDIDDVIGCFEFYANVAKDLDNRQWTPPLAEFNEDGFNALMRYEPVGVVAAITAWNYPLLLCSWKIAPALAAGCTIVIKPSEITPLTSLLFCELIQKLSIPPGVINFIYGTGPITGELLINHSDIDKISFTGSVPTGSHIMNVASKDIKNITLELGGKSAAIVLPSSFPPPNNENNILIRKRTIEWIMFGVFWTNGQICSATSRLLLHKNIYHEFINELKNEVENRIKIGDPLDDTTKIGPVVSEIQWNRVMTLIQSGINEGAEILCGETGGDLNIRRKQYKGYFIKPTIFININPNMEIWKKEIFGPVLSVMSFDNEDEAIRLANDSEYGLASAIFTQDQQQMNRISTQMRTGIVWNNCSQPCFYHLPWGGMKKSGIGRDLGIEGLNGFLEPKQVCQYISNEPLGWYFPAKL